DDRGGNGFGLGHGQEVGEILAGDTGEREVLAVDRSLESRDDFADLIQISLVQRRVRPDRKTQSVRDQQDTADQIVNRGGDRASSINAMIDGDLKNVEIAKVITRPLVDRRAVADADRRIWPL